MSSRIRVHSLIFAALVAMFLGVGLNRLAAQQTTGTILGTVTDSSGGAIPTTDVQIKNDDTGQTQTVQSDAQGRFRMPDLPSGNYEVQASKAGFSTEIHKGITLSIGAEQVVDFSLPVGQVAQTVTVEGEVSQVETTSSEVSSLVSPTQMRDLPLNGRDFEQLIQLAPGVQNYYAGSSPVGTGEGAIVREGRDPAISVAGARPEGVAFLMDDQNLESFYNRGLGTISGTSLGVDAIAEFQVITNTYGAQFGGNGAVMNSVSKSGTNSFHGSLFEFLRNSGMDARNFNDLLNAPAQSFVPEFRRNQYGGTIGGPIKKDKLFFFFNYEGTDSVQGFSATPTVPLTRTSTAANPVTAAAVNAVLALYPVATFNIKPASGTGQTTVVKNETGLENYVLGRLDYTISNKDSLFGRYFIDQQRGVNPFSGGGQTGEWGELDLGRNQFFNLEERHIFSSTMINTLRVSYGRTEENSVATNSYPAMQFFPGEGRSDGSISVGGGITTLGTPGASPEPQLQLQNRFAGGDDLAWTRGAHSLRFGFSTERVQSQTLWTNYNGATWTFTNLANFLNGTALQVVGVPNNPNNNPVRNFRELDFAMYAQDDWKVLPRLTLNLGLRYAPALNPTEANDQLYTITNAATATAFTQVSNVFKTNVSLLNIDPRIGFAYDVFGDHKTAIRGGFGMFHDVVFAGEYADTFINAPPWNVVTQLTPPFPNLFTGVTTTNLTLTTSWDWNASKTPYMEEYHLDIERQFPLGLLVSIGYVGSHGVDLYVMNQRNPVPATIVNGVYVFSPTCGATNTLGGPLVCPASNSGRDNPALGSLSSSVNGSSSRYNSLQATVNRALSHNVQAQLAYTYSKCMDDVSGEYGSLSGNSPTSYENPYNPGGDEGVCGFNVSQSLRLNTLGILPFHGNRFVEGWQLTGILAVSTGLPFDVTDGVDQSNQINGAPRPNYAPNNPAVTINGISYPACNNTPILGTAAMWFNPNCFSQEAFGTLGNLGRDFLYGPGLFDLDMGVLKTTKIRENMTLQFRGELFNVLNHTNLSLPLATLFSGTPGPTTTLGRSTTTGEILTPAVPSREIQLGLKLIF